MYSPQHKKIIQNTLIVIGIIFAFFLGYIFGNKNTTTNAAGQQNQLITTHGDFTQFWNVWSLLDEKYPFKEKIPADTDRMYGAIAGMVASFKDPYTMFFPPKEAKLFAEDVKGEFSGVGMEVGMKDGILTVISPLKGSPAERSGVLAGDYIIKVDGKTTEGMSPEEAITLIRGKAGTSVILTIARKGNSNFQDITIVRETIAMPIIETKIDGDIFIINFYSFSETSPKLFADAFQKFKESGLKKMIIDLRNNPGGYMDAAVDIGSYFIPQGKIIIRESFGETQPETIYRSNGTDEMLPRNFKLIVLVNGGSASASEILAGALSEHGVAKTVGTQTFGKGSVQELIPLTDGSSVKITVAKWFTPNGISISEKGITPDYVVTPGDTKSDTDTVLDEAKKLLGTTKK
jgi:carboxyl-terminal processing protease